MNINRIILYVHYDPDSIVDLHIVYQIKKLYEYGCKIIFISNSEISNKKTISKYIIKLIIRNNKGFDFYAWKEVLFSQKREYWYKYDELILMNSSCYGPIFHLSELFNKMNSIECDFWGITLYYKDNKYQEHINSYFINFKRNIIKSEKFWDFFESIKCHKNVNDVIKNYETTLTHYLKKKWFHL